MLKKLLASVGIGKATVDAILLSDSLRAGDDFDVEVVITGGDVEQELNAIELAVMAQAKTEADVGDSEVTYNKSVVLQHWHQALNLTVAPGEVITRQLTLTLHPETPATELFGQQISKVWLQTGLDIKNGIDGSDKDSLYIRPSATQLAVLDMVEHSGYTLLKWISKLAVCVVKALVRTCLAIKNMSLNRKAARCLARKSWKSPLLTTVMRLAC